MSTLYGTIVKHCKYTVLYATLVNTLYEYTVRNNSKTLEVHCTVAILANSKKCWKNWKKFKLLPTLEMGPQPALFRP